MVLSNFCHFSVTTPIPCDFLIKKAKKILHAPRHLIFLRRSMLQLGIKISFSPMFPEKSIIQRLLHNKNQFCIAAICAITFFLTHPFTGIDGDNEVYFLHVLQSWFPERYIGDLEFIGGDQGSFSLFSYLYGTCIHFAGAFYGTAILAYVMIAFWGIACALLTTAIDRRTAPLLFLCAIAFKIHYGPVPWVHYGEMLCTPRVLAEACALLGCYFVIKEKKWASLSLFFLGTLMHPLIAGWFLPIWLLHYYPKFSWPLLIISILFPLSFLLNRKTFAQFDPVWNNAADEFRHWTPAKIGRAMAYLSLVWSVSRLLGDKRNQHFWNSALLIGIIAYWWTAASILFKHIFLTQAQPWRIEWFFSVLAMILCCYFILHLHKIKSAPIPKRRKIPLCAIAISAIAYIAIFNFYNEYQWLFYNGGWASILYASPRVPLFLSAFLFCSWSIFHFKWNFFIVFYTMFLFCIACYLTVSDHIKEDEQAKQLNIFLQQDTGPFAETIHNDYAHLFYAVSDIYARTYWASGGYYGVHSFMTLSRERYLASQSRTYHVLNQSKILKEPFIFPYHWAHIGLLCERKDSLQATAKRLLESGQIHWVVSDQNFYNYPKVDSLYLQAFHRWVYLYKARAI